MGTLAQTYRTAPGAQGEQGTALAAGLLEARAVAPAEGYEANAAAARSVAASGGLWWKRAFCALLLCLAGAAAAPDAQAQFWPPSWWPEEEEEEEVDVPDVAMFTDAVSTFEATIKLYVSDIRGMAADLLFLLIALEIAISGAMWGMSRTDMSELVWGLGLKVLVWGVLFKVIADTGDPGGLLNMESIPNGFRNMAHQLFGVPSGWSSVVYPGDVLIMGFTEGARIFARGMIKGWWFVSFSGLMGGVAALVTIFGFAVVAIRHWVAIINAVIATLMGLIMLGFAGWRGTAGMADRYIIWVFNASIKLFFLDAILYLASPVMGNMFSEAVDEGLLDTLLGASMWPVIALTFVGVALYIPSVAARVITENVTTGLQNAVSR